MTSALTVLALTIACLWAMERLFTLAGLDRRPGRRPPLTLRRYIRQVDRIMRYGRRPKLTFGWYERAYEMQQRGMTPAAAARSIEFKRSGTFLRVPPWQPL
jgi:hypothetical protein